MLFPYIYLPEHNIYKLQEWIDQLFLDVWCKANIDIEYSVDILPFDIRELTLEIYNNESIKNDYFYGPIETVYKIFQLLDQEKKDTLAKHYLNNNSIEDLCEGKTECVPCFYSDLSELNEPLKVALENFFKNLYDSVINLEQVKTRLNSSLDRHYKDFIKVNNKGVCPICGLMSLDSEDDYTREAYDHYLPKFKYPFNTINFKNIVPMCDKCNSKNKGPKDPLFLRKGERRKAFYLYSNKSYNIELAMSLKNDDLEHLKPEDIELEIGPSMLEEEIATWDDLYRISNRYKATCCKASNYKYWIMQITEEFEGQKMLKKDAWTEKMSEAEGNPYNEINFIRKPFLEACKAKGIFE
jgi:hypothetical protein